MKHGNVYPPERTQVALERFFTEANLTALRELALRLVARKVEGQLEETTASSAIPLITDRVLVLVDGGPGSTRAIRTGAELAGAMHAALVAVVVETPEDTRMPFDQKRDLQEAIDDAVDLGATVVHVEAPDVVTGLEQVATARRASHVVLPFRPRSGIKRLTEKPVTEAILERMPQLKVHLVAERTKHLH
jgi:two-component system sensor histidine kinase KdpD